MSLAAAQQVSSSPSTPVNEPVFARLHVHLNYRAQKKAGVCLSRRAKSILMKETVGRAWDFNHGDTETPPRSSQVPVISVQHLTHYIALICSLYHTGNGQVGNQPNTNLIFGVTFEGNQTLLVGSCVLISLHNLWLNIHISNFKGV